MSWHSFTISVKTSEIYPSDTTSIFEKRRIWKTGGKMEHFYALVVKTPGFTIWFTEPHQKGTLTMCWFPYCCQSVMVFRFFGNKKRVLMRFHFSRKSEIVVCRIHLSYAWFNSSMKSVFPKSSINSGEIHCVTSKFFFFFCWLINEICFPNIIRQ